MAEAYRFHTCSNCDHWHPHGGASPQSGDCRVRAPRTIPSMIHVDEFGGTTVAIRAASFFPMSENDAACGEHSQRHDRRLPC